MVDIILKVCYNRRRMIYFYNYWVPSKLLVKQQRCLYGMFMPLGGNAVFCKIQQNSR